jgi:lysine-specific demethylase 8
MGTVPAEVPVATALGSDDFRRDYLNLGRPVILRGIIGHWPAAQLWDAEYFRDKVGHKEVVVQVAPDGVFGLDPDKGGPRYEPRYMPLGDYIETFAAPPAQGRHYLQRLSIPHALPELLEDFSNPPYVKAKQVYLTNLWFGPAGNVTRLHYDVPNNFFAQIRGRKRFVLFPPTETARLYPHRTKAYNMSRVDLERPDLAAFPKFQSARRLECIVQAGDLLFLPAYWWHQVYSLDEGISINFWSIPGWRQFIAPQMFDTMRDILAERWHFLIHKSGSTFRRRAPDEHGANVSG